MASKLYLFNPEHDMALANFTPYYQPPQEIVRMGEDLSYLPLWYACPGEEVMVADRELAGMNVPFPDYLRLVFMLPGKRPDLSCLPGDGILRLSTVCRKEE